MRRVNFTRPYRDRNGRIGARAKLRCQSSSYVGFYEFDTHGMDEAATAARVEELELEHERKAERLSGFRSSILNHEITISQERFVLTDAVIRRRGVGAIELSLVVKRRVGESWARFDSSRISRFYPSIDTLPSDEEILALVRVTVEEWALRQGKSEAFVRRVSQLTER